MGRDTSASDRNVEFEIAVINASAFADAALREGVDVSEQEVERRVEFYKQLYPGQRVESGKVKTIILAEAYLDRKGMRPDEGETDSIFNTKFDVTRFASIEQVELAKRTEQLHLLLAREDVQHQAQNLEDISRLQLSNEYKPPTMWAQSDLQVQGDPEECLAWDGRNCLIPLREYNAATAYYPVSIGMMLDSAKAIILKRYLMEKRLAVTARDQGLAFKADSLLPRVKQKKDDYPWMRATIAFGRPVRDQKSLEAAYTKYYGRYFGAREVITLAIIGSSDSAYVDSLYLVFQSWNRKRATERKSGLPASKEPTLPWSYFKEPQVSEELVALTDSLKVGQCSLPFRSSRGCFLVRLVEAATAPEVSFNHAYLRLVYLATRDKFLDMDSVVEARAKKYYAANIARYTFPDTMALRAWLIPQPGPSSFAKAVRQGKIPIVADTARFKSMEISSLALPTELRIALQERLRQDSAHLFLGPLLDHYGRWYFQVRSRRRAHSVIPFRLARKDILDRMTALPEEQGSGTASDEAQDEVGANLALAQALRRTQFQKRMKDARRNAPEVGVVDITHPDKLSESEQVKSIEAASARIRAEEAKERAEEDRMLKEARVDLNRLFQ